MSFFNNFLYDLRKNKTLLAMLMPACVFFFVFAYLPMVGIIIAFKRLDYALGIFKSQWVGFDNFRFFFISGQAFMVTRNTVLYNLAFIIFGTLLQLCLAIFLAEIGNKVFKRASQAVIILPYFISWVIVAAMAYNMFNFEFGSLNSLLVSLGMERIDIYSAEWMWKYILVFFNSWKYAGYGSIIYLAAITSIDVGLYESANIDGANKFQQVWHITLPSLQPTIVILTLLSIGRIFKGDFDMFYQLIGGNGLLFNATDVIDTFVFRSLLSSQEYGMAAASGFYQSVLCLIVLTLTNKVVVKLDKSLALF